MSDEINYDNAFKAVISRAVTDADFRAKCLSNPAAAAEEIGVTLPAGAKFSERAGAGGAVLLPALGADPDEIHDEVLLADVAGGNLGPEYGGYHTNVVQNPSCMPQEP